jgi:hypothetical protein
VRNIFLLFSVLPDFYTKLGSSLRKSDLLKFSGYLLRFQRYKLFHSYISISVWQQCNNLFLKNSGLYTIENYKLKSINDGDVLFFATNDRDTSRSLHFLVQCTDKN